MLQSSRRWRLFLLALCAVLAVRVLAQSPALTTVSDTVFRADGTPATGVLLISWPPFTTSDGHAVAAGTKSVALASDGTFSVQLAPNIGSAPAGVTYTVVYQLSDGTVKTEHWGVGTTSPQTVAQVRTILGTGTPTGQLATQQYVNAALPNVRGFQQYPARITMTYDDPGLIDGSHQYIQGLLPLFQRKGVPLSISVVTGYPLSQELVPTFQQWIDAGWDVNAHSVSHQYFIYPDAFTLQYTGTAASSVTLSIANKRFTITAPGDPNAQVNWDLTSSGTDLVPSGLDTIGGLIYTLNQRGVFAVTQDPNLKTAVKSEDLADVPPQDIKNAAITVQLDKNRLISDELSWTMAWMSANLRGLPSNRVYVYPGSYEDATTEAIAVSTGYAGSRGSGTMQPSPNASTVMGTGINIQNILSQGVAPNLQTADDTELAKKIHALVFKSSVWGVPYGIFWHMNELSEHQVSTILDSLKASGATLMTNTQLVNYLLSTQQDAGTTYYADSVSGRAVDVRPTAASPVVTTGAVLPPEFKYDLLGADQTRFGWNIGAYGYVPESVGTAK